MSFSRSSIAVTSTPAAARVALVALATAGAAVLGSLPVAAQEAPDIPGLTNNDSTLVDRVVAVVGDSVITMTQVLEEYQVLQARGQGATPRQILDELVNIQLVLQAAARDTTLVVPEEEIEGRVESAVEDIRSRFPNEQAYQQALSQQNLTPQQYRDQLKDRIRTEQVQQMFVRKHLPSTPAVSITEEEMREFFESSRSSLQARPEALTIDQVFVAPTPSDSAWARAQAVADSLRALIVAGPDSLFAVLAREHSDDPSAAEGGEMGWFRRGVMVTEFEQAAFNLNDMQVSQAVRTRFGYHLIRVDKQRPGEVNARHILIRPEVSPDDALRAETRATEVARRAREGESLDSLRTEFGDTDVPSRITVSRDQVPQLPYPPGTLTGVTEGEVVGPVEVSLGGQQYQTVLKIQEIREAGEFTFDDLRDQIRSELSRRKRIDRIYERLRATTYVDIRM